MNIHDRAYWNSHAYGKSIIVPKKVLQAAIISLGIIIPVIVPVPLTIFAASQIKENFRF